MTNLPKGLHCIGKSSLHCLSITSEQYFMLYLICIENTIKSLVHACGISCLKAYTFIQIVTFSTSKIASDLNRMPPFLYPGYISQQEKRLPRYRRTQNNCKPVEISIFKMHTPQCSYSINLYHRDHHHVHLGLRHILFGFYTLVISACWIWFWHGSPPRIQTFLHFISSNYEMEDIGFLNPYTNSLNPFELWITRNWGRIILYLKWECCTFV